MIYTMHAVEPHLLQPLWDRLWDRGKEEFNRLGYSLRAAYDLCIDMAKTGGDGFILCADENPVLVAGTVPDGDGRATYFQATQDFDKHAIKITKVVRNRAINTKPPVYIYSVMVHPDSERWFGVLGFTRDKWCGKTQAGYPLYRFRKD